MLTEQKMEYHTLTQIGDPALPLSENEEQGDPEDWWHVSPSSPTLHSFQPEAWVTSGHNTWETNPVLQKDYPFNPDTSPGDSLLPNGVDTPEPIRKQTTLTSGREKPGRDRERCAAVEKEVEHQETPREERGDQTGAERRSGTRRPEDTRSAQPRFWRSVAHTGTEPSPRVGREKRDGVARTPSSNPLGLRLPESHHKVRQ